ncbi:MAG: hypothetical protein Q9165_006200 [Trypethelium subeluteriae]
MPFVCEDSRWRALTRRDPSANGHFVYCVKSTRIYCRPNCSARLARRANVEFHDSPAQAEAAGFRPCKRCRPSMEQEIDPPAAAVEKARAILVREAERRNVQAPQPGEEAVLKLQDLAGMVGLTTSYFHKIFRQKTGMTPKRYLDALTASTNKSELCSHLEAAARGISNGEIHQEGAISANSNLDEDPFSWIFDPADGDNLSGSIDQSPVSLLMATESNSMLQNEEGYSAGEPATFSHKPTDNHDCWLTTGNALVPEDWLQMLNAPVCTPPSITNMHSGLLTLGEELLIDYESFWNNDANVV